MLHTCKTETKDAICETPQCRPGQGRGAANASGFPAQRDNLIIKYTKNLCSLYENSSPRHPKTFSLIDKLEQFPEDSLNTICNLANLNQKIIAIELKQFMLANFDEDEGIEVKLTEQIKCNKCTKCLYCAFILLQELSYQSNLLCNLFILYKFTNCERIFSKLKIIKTKLQSSLHQEHLNLYVLMYSNNK
ncbi:zinc finger MYM-type protein 1-like [Aphis craccivora]|uniref:Zinc finger MYM-type protein 1-like n=1 Tax=Aphis craccivora TaxID=307492 RepID=A0A6G0ZGL5_APHCR|nr:zinc finger MYM-type protein 1-like [Aphis craccivora]